MESWEPTSQFFIISFLCSALSIARRAPCASNRNTHYCPTSTFIKLHTIARSRSFARSFKELQNICHSTNLWRWYVFKLCTYYIAADNDLSLLGFKETVLALANEITINYVLLADSRLQWFRTIDSSNECKTPTWLKLLQVWSAFSLWRERLAWFVCSICASHFLVWWNKLSFLEWKLFRCLHFKF